MNPLLERLVFSLLLASTFAVDGIAADWPTYLGDSGRRGSSAETAAFPLHATWTYRGALPPRPAWPEPATRDITNQRSDLRPEMTFDRAFGTIAAAGSVFFGSSADDCVVALEASTGREKWRFFTEAPVRFAPTYFEGTLLAGSDDGAVYCLDAADGSLRWKHAGAAKRWFLPGNGRLMSLWPIRTGVVVEDSTAYFVAGMFPKQGQTLFALDPRTGDTVWKRTVTQPAQGYMLASDTTLFVPAGRSNPTAYKRADGTELGSIPGAGGAYAVVDQGTVIGGPGIRDKKLEVSDAKTRQSLASFGGLRMAVAGDLAFVQYEDKTEAFERTRFMQLSRELADARRDAEALKKRLESAKEEETKREIVASLASGEEKAKELEAARRKCFPWTVKTDLSASLIAVDGAVFLGGAGRVAALDTRTGKTVWSAPVDGTAHGLAFSDGRLLVSTDRGAIHAFTEKNVPHQEVLEKASPLSPTADDGAAAEIAVSKAATDQGYCLVLGCKTPEAILPILSQTRFDVVICEPDVPRAEALRRAFHAAGVYGRRVAVHVGPAEDRLPYPDYFANLVFHDAASGPIQVPPAEIARVLRPYGGTAVFVGGTGPESAATLGNWGEGILPDWKVETIEDRAVATAHRGELPGAGEWTHTYAEPGNTACSGDVLVEGPFRVQWFGLPGPRRMVDRHFRNVPPLLKSGRLFAPGNEIVFVLDAYNGAPLWTVELPGSRRMGVFLGTTNLVVDGAYLYAVMEDRCRRFAVADGAEVEPFILPEDSAENSEWGYLARTGNLLLGSTQPKGTSYRTLARDNELNTEPVWYPNMKLATSTALFALGAADGKPRWAYSAGRILDTTLAVHDGAVFFLESTAPRANDPTTGRAAMRAFISGGEQYLTAIDLESGEPRFRVRVDLRDFQQPTYLSAASGILLLSGSKIDRGEHITASGYEAVKQTRGGEVIHYYFQAHDAKNGEILWTSDHATDLAVRGGHGEFNRHPTLVGEAVYAWPYKLDLKTGKRDPEWKFDRQGHGCGNVSASCRQLFWRGGNPWYRDLTAEDAAGPLNTVTRPGCFINILPAGGLVLIPEASSGCTCAYPLQMSVVYAPEVPKE